MAAAYDTYDYPTYWEGREYEHESEVIALKSLLKQIPEIKKCAEIGAGYARLTPYYIYRSDKVILTDPSGRLLKMARKNLEERSEAHKVKFIQSKLENLGGKIRKNSVDLTLIIRVLHHIDNIDEAFKYVKKITKKNGYFIMEFANKRHVKALMAETVKGNFTFICDIFPKDITSKEVDGGLPFKNYHPDIIRKKLKDLGFEIIEVRSVSNIRIPLIKNLIPLEVLLSVEKYLQKLLAKLNFGPSIFLLAKNTG